ASQSLLGRARALPQLLSTATLRVARGVRLLSGALLGQQSVPGVHRCPGDTLIVAADSNSLQYRRYRLGPEVSIGMSAYGNAATTRRALEALFASAEGDFELLLVDDCSPDNRETRSLFLQTADRHANTKVFGFATNREYTGSLDAILSHA